MKYKVLLAGNNSSVIDVFFLHMTDNFDVLTTSNRYDDIVRHLQIFSPDAFVYCIYNETRDDLKKMVSLGTLLSRKRIPFILIGTKKECDEFERIVVNTADLILHKPLTTGSIQEKILGFLKKWGGADEKEESQKNTSQKLSSAVEEEMRKEVPDLGALLHFGKTEKEKTVEKARKHILVVDDDSLMLRSIKGHLQDEYNVATAVSGRVAFRFLEKKKTDLILLDYKMPEEDGPAVLEKLRANDATKDIPVIFLTGISEREKIQKALVMKPQAYLLKPVEHDKLLDTIKKILG